MKIPTTFRPPHILLAILAALLIPTFAEEIQVTNAAQLQAALSKLKNGTVIKIGPGDYPGGHSVEHIENLTVEALDPRDPPHFKGGACAWQFSRCPGLTLRHLRMSNQTANGLNFDDGGDFKNSVKGITLEHIDVSDIGPRGNHDGIKCSGLDSLTVRHCTLTGWGGQGIDLVGCHHTTITQCTFTGKAGFTATAGVQIKGGSSHVTVEKCHFTNAGERPLNIGGSTDPAYFRPPGAKHEASQIIVRDNTVEGSLCSAAFVGVDGAEFIGNTLLFPGKWIFRILQESQDPQFTPCRNVLIQANRIIFHRSQIQTEINIGPGTAPDTFRFEKNQWFAEDRPQSSQPMLPTREKEGRYGIDPR